jgi:hypothetical protein
MVSMPRRPAPKTSFGVAGLVAPPDIVQAARKRRLNERKQASARRKLAWRVFESGMRARYKSIAFQHVNLSTRSHRHKNY